MLFRDHQYRYRGISTLDREEQPQILFRRVAEVEHDGIGLPLAQRLQRVFRIPF